MQRIRFERMYGEDMGFVDLKGTKLRPSNPPTRAIVEDWLKGFRGPQEEAGQKFIDFYASYSNGFLNSKLVDSDTDHLKNARGK